MGVGTARSHHPFPREPGQTHLISIGPSTLIHTVPSLLVGASGPRAAASAPSACPPPQSEGVPVAVPVVSPQHPARSSGPPPCTVRQGNQLDRNRKHTKSRRPPPPASSFLVSWSGLRTPPNTRPLTHTHTRRPSVDNALHTHGLLSVTHLTVDCPLLSLLNTASRRHLEAPGSAREGRLSGQEDPGKSTVGTGPLNHHGPFLALLGSRPFPHILCRTPYALWMV